jgi:6,7-dimethyl-8-ribityllumazine synthase
MTTFEGTFAQDSSSFRFAIVISRFNDLVTEKLLSGCQDCLKRHGIDIDSQVDYIWIPGCFEIPLVASKAAKSGRYDAVICLGAIIRGQTAHFDYVAGEAAKGIAAVSRETEVPIIFGVLTTDTMQQALERAGIKSNLGWNYALNALEMASLLQEINTKMTYVTYEGDQSTQKAIAASDVHNFSTKNENLQEEGLGARD